MEGLSYYLPFTTSYNGILSVDKIRIVAQKCHGFDSFLRSLSARSILFNYKQYYRFNNLSYNTMTYVSIDDISIVIGTDWRNIKGNITDSVFIEFNPNKVFNNDLMIDVYCLWFKNVKSLVLKRFDVALDIMLPRGQLWLDKRSKLSYTFIKSESITEYLGTRKSDFRIKLYDKSKESGLDYPLTRFEITLDHLPPLDKLNEYINYMCSVGDYKSCPNNNDRLVLTLLYESGNIGYYLNSFNRSKRNTLKKYTDSIDFSLCPFSYGHLSNLLCNILKGCI